VESPVVRLRRPDWEPRLNAWLQRCADRPHRWGSHDCLMFGAGACRAVTGHDPGRGHRGKYRSAASANRYLRGLGYLTPEALADALWTRIAPAMAQRGDWVLHQDSIGVCIGRDAMFVGEEGSRRGLVRIPLLDCDAAWRVG
jgi:hypothetical protein